jgi:hypothetical protein
VIAIASGFLVAIAAHFSWDAWLQFFPIESSDLGLIEIHLRTVIDRPVHRRRHRAALSGLIIEGRALAEQLRKESMEGAGAICLRKSRSSCTPGRDSFNVCVR